MYKFGFIGTGNMGGALARKVAAHIGGKNVILNNRNMDKATIIANKYNASIGSAGDVVKDSQFVMLGVKPQGLGDLLKSLKNDVTENNIFVTMAAGKEMQFICDALKKDVPVIRIMPNMPAKIGEGMTLACRNHLVTDEMFKEFTDSMDATGLIDEVSEDMIDRAMAISGCGPAYIYMMIEALRDGGVNLGIEKTKALQYAMQTMYGSVKLLMETGDDVSRLRESICSPGGTTIEGVKVLNDGGFDKLVSDCLKAGFERSEALK